MIFAKIDLTITPTYIPVIQISGNGSVYPNNLIGESLDTPAASDSGPNSEPFDGAVHRRRPGNRFAVDDRCHRPSHREGLARLEKQQCSGNESHDWPVGQVIG